MRRTLYQSYLSKTTERYRNQHPREAGIMETLSEIVERKESFENLPNALPKLHEFHKLLIDKSKVKDEGELEVVATMMTACLSMMIVDRQFRK